MFKGILLDSSPNVGAWLTPRVRRVSSFAGLVAFAVGAAAIPHFPWFRSPWSWLEGGLVSAFTALFYALMVSFVAADARRVGMRPGCWRAAVLLFHVAGLVWYLISSARRTGDWRRIALPLATTFEALLVGVCVVMPLLSTAALPRLASLTPLPPPPVGAPRHSQQAGQRTLRARPTNSSIIYTHVVIPQITAKLKEAEITPESGGLAGLVPGLSTGAENGVIGGLFPETGETIPLPPPSKPSNPRPRIIVGGVVEAAKLIFGPTPEYPALARMARIEGTVRLKAIIGQDGTIQDLKVLGGPPLLVNAAVQAVESWRYQPTLLDHEPVEVETEIEVKFRLSE